MFFLAARQACVTFHYSMYGVGMGTLQVQTKGEHGTPRTVWTKQGNQGEGWHKAEIDVDMNDPFTQVRTICESVIHKW